jgi:hypothetical protein
MFPQVKEVVRIEVLGNILGFIKIIKEEELTQDAVFLTQC